MTGPVNVLCVLLPLRITAAGVELSFVSTVTTFGTAQDVTLSELSIETFYPADLRAPLRWHRCCGAVALASDRSPAGGRAGRGELVGTCRSDGQSLGSAGFGG